MVSVEGGKFGIIFGSRNIAACTMRCSCVNKEFISLKGKFFNLFFQLRLNHFALRYISTTQYNRDEGWSQYATQHKTRLFLPQNGVDFAQNEVVWVLKTAFHITTITHDTVFVQSMSIVLMVFFFEISVLKGTKTKSKQKVCKKNTLARATQVRCVALRCLNIWNSFLTKYGLLL